MVDYKTILSTTDQKVTLMQWIQTLAEEFGNATITDMLFENVGNKSLTFTFKLEDGTTKTATIALYSLSADEKTMIDNLYMSVTASTDGVTFTQAVAFQGNETHGGNEIHNGYSSFLGDENHAGSEIHKGTATFTDLRADDITATDGQELMSWDGTTTALKGKADRPTYNGGEMALLDDAHKANDVYIFVSHADYPLGNYSDRYLHNNYLYDTVFQGKNVYVLNGEIMNTHADITHMFMNFACDSVTIDSIGACNSMYFAFGSNHTNVCVKKVNAFDTSKVNNCGSLFYGNTLIQEIPAFDFSNVENFKDAFFRCKSITSFLATGMKVSFSLSSSNMLSAEALRTVIDNLADGSASGTTQTLTLGSTNLAKMNADDITTANNKGWTLA